MHTTTMTIEQAKAEGYIHCSPQIEDFGHLWRVDELSDTDLEDKPIYLAEKEPYYIPFTTKMEVAETLADIIAAKNCDETRDDTDDVYDIVNSLDFQPVVEMINAALAHKKYYKLTKIQLVKTTSNEQ